MIQPGDRVVLGYIAIFRQLISSYGPVCVSVKNSDFYTSYRYVLPNGTILNLLGVKYCFWGSLSEHLVERICSLGAAEVIYSAKLGALTSPADLYTRAFCPSSFANLEHDKVVRLTEGVPNGLLRKHPTLDSGLHVSVPTVLEEDYLQRSLTIQLGATSIDNEIAYMAAAVAMSSARSGREILFSALHFATDYLRTESECGKSVAFDLSNNQEEPARKRRDAFIARIFQEVLGPYFFSFV